MSRVPRRAWIEVTAAVAVVLAACALLSREADRDARAASDSLEASRWELVQNRTRVAPAAMRAIRDQTAARRAAFRASSTLQQDESNLYAKLSQLATQRGVQIEQLVPAATNAPAPTPPAPETAGAATPTIGAQCTYTMTVVGPFARLAEFVQDLEGAAGFTAVRSLRMAPIDASPTSPIRAVLITDHFGIVAAHLGEEELP